MQSYTRRTSCWCQDDANLGEDDEEWDEGDGRHVDGMVSTFHGLELSPSTHGNEAAVWAERRVSGISM